MCICKKNQNHKNYIFHQNIVLSSFSRNFLQRNEAEFNQYFTLSSSLNTFLSHSFFISKYSRFHLFLYLPPWILDKIYLYIIACLTSFQAFVVQSYGNLLSQFIQTSSSIELKIEPQTFISPLQTFQQKNVAFKNKIFSRYLSLTP